MTWPSSDVNTTNADAGTDIPATFRTDVLDLLTKFNLLRNHVSSFGQTLLNRATAAVMRGDLGAAASGANGDITNMTALTTINSGPLAGMRNRIINGNFQVAQSGTVWSIATGSALSYLMDRWYGAATGANLSTTRITSGGGYRMQVAYSSGTNTGFVVGQRIESLASFPLVGSNAVFQAKLASNLLTSIIWTAYYATTTNSFGTPAGYTRTQIATGTFTINSTEATYSASLGTIPAGASAGIEIVFSSAVGLTTGKTFTLGDVQLESGSVATAFEFRHISQEITLCRRYLRPVFLGNSVVSLGNFPGIIGYVNTTTTALFPLPPDVYADMLRGGAFNAGDYLGGLYTGNSPTVNGVAITSFTVYFDTAMGLRYFMATVASGLTVGQAALLLIPNIGGGIGSLAMWCEI